MLTETKKIHKNVKIENFEKRKNGLEIWWKGSYPQNLASILAAVSETLEFTDHGQTDGGRLRHNSSSAV